MTTDRATVPIEILLAEDNPGDIRLTREAFKRGRVPTNINVANNGEDVISYLRREGKYEFAVRPDLIVLDLNMPRKDGRAVLAEIKHDPKLDCIPIVVLTSSDADEDIVACYKLHASCFISKPFEVKEYNAVIRSIEEFWLTIAKLPKRC